MRDYEACRLESQERERKRLANLTGGKRGKSPARQVSEARCSECGGSYEIGEDRSKPCGLCFDVALWEDYLGAFSLFLFAKGERKRKLRECMRDELRVRLLDRARLANDRCPGAGNAAQDIAIRLAFE